MSFISGDRNDLKPIQETCRTIIVSVVLRRFNPYARFFNFTFHTIF
jgi:hypothetical protein